MLSIIYICSAWFNTSHDYRCRRIYVFGQHHHTQQKCFDRKQRGVNHIISYSARSIRLRVSLPLGFYKPDPVWPVDPKTARQNISDNVAGISDGHASPRGNLFPLKCLCDFLASYLFISFAHLFIWFWGCLSAGGFDKCFCWHFTPSPASSLICKSILKWNPLSFFTFQVYKPIGCSCFWLASSYRSKIFVWCFLNYRCHKIVSVYLA